MYMESALTFYTHPFLYIQERDLFQANTVLRFEEPIRSLPFSRLIYCFVDRACLEITQK